MNHTTEQIEEIAALSLLAEDRHLHPDAAENLLAAIQLGLLSLESVQEERNHLEQSIKAGRQVMTFSGVPVC